MEEQPPVRPSVHPPVRPTVSPAELDLPQLPHELISMIRDFMPSRVRHRMIMSCPERHGSRHLFLWHESMRDTVEYIRSIRHNVVSNDTIVMSKVVMPDGRKIYYRVDTNHQYCLAHNYCVPLVVNGKVRAHQIMHELFTQGIQCVMFGELNYDDVIRLYNYAKNMYAAACAK